MHWGKAQAPFCCHAHWIAAVVLPAGHYLRGFSKVWMLPFSCVIWRERGILKTLSMDSNFYFFSFKIEGRVWIMDWKTELTKGSHLVKRFHLRVSTKQDRWYKCAIWRVRNELISSYWAKASGFLRHLCLPSWTLHWELLYPGHQSRTLPKK